MSKYDEVDIERCLNERKLYDPRYTKADDAWIWTNSGKKFSYTHTDPSQICIEDIACALSKICRYSGHVDRHYSVADHCSNIVDHLISIGCTNYYFILGALLHDASEAYLSDIPAPAKKLLPDFAAMEKRIYRAIAARFGAPDDEEFHRDLSYYDKNIVRDEAEILFTPVPDWVNQFEKIGINIEISPHYKVAETRYLETYWDIMDRLQANHEDVYE